MIDEVKIGSYKSINVLEKILNSTILSHKSQKLIEKILNYYAMFNTSNTTTKPERIFRK